jgi:hypothetical protein
VSESSQTDERLERQIQAEASKIEAREEARRRIAAKRADDAFTFPEPGRTLVDDLAHPPRSRKFTIDHLHPAGGNTLLVAQFKTGKTTLLLNLVRSLADRVPFLNEFEVSELSGRVAFWNYELDADQFREWVRDLSLDHPEHVAEPLHLRGLSLRLWDDAVAEKAVEWLRANEAEFLIVDPAARAWRGLVDNENDNAQVAAFTDALDAIKRAAGVRDLVLSTHMGRTVFEENAERARGATRLEDWMDAGWYLSKDRSGPRSLRAMGRDVDLDALDLRYEEASRRLSATGRTRDERRQDDGIQKAVDALALVGNGVPTNAVEAAMQGEKGKRSGWILAAVGAGLIERRYENGEAVDESRPRPGKAMRCSLTEAGRERASRRIKRNPSTSSRWVVYPKGKGKRHAK